VVHSFRENPAHKMRMRASIGSVIFSYQMASNKKGNAWYQATVDLFSFLSQGLTWAEEFLVILK